MKNVDGHKLDARSKKYRFIGYPKESIGYYFYNPTQQKVFVGRHAILLEKEFIQKGGNGRSIKLEEVQNLQSIQNSQVDSQPDVPIVETQLVHTPPLRRSSKMHNVPLRYGFIIENDNTSHIIENDDPTTYSEAVMSSDSDKWLNARKFEMDSIYTNQV